MMPETPATRASENRHLAVSDYTEVTSTDLSNRPPDPLSEGNIPNSRDQPAKRNWHNRVVLFPKVSDAQFQNARVQRDLHLPHETMQVVVVGAGLCGLVITRRLHESGVPVVLLEAEQRLGGQIEAVNVPPSRMPVEIGATSIHRSWHRIKSLLQELKIEEIPTASDGLVLDDVRGIRLRRMRLSSGPTTRVRNGFSSVIGKLYTEMSECVYNGYRVECLNRTDYLWRILVRETGSDKVFTIRAFRIVFAMPPKTFLRSVFLGDTSIPKRVKQYLVNIPTSYPSGRTFVATYTEPFWRKGGAASVWSYNGPMREVTEQVDELTACYALVGRIYSSSEFGKIQEQTIVDECLQQLRRWFGQSALSPLAKILVSWGNPRDENFGIACAARNRRAARRKYYPPANPPPKNQELMKEFLELEKSGLIFASSDLALSFRGTIEGALEEAERAIAALKLELL